MTHFEALWANTIKPHVKVWQDLFQNRFEFGNAAYPPTQVVDHVTHDAIHGEPHK